jgi:hypothetical protein
MMSTQVDKDAADIASEGLLSLRDKELRAGGTMIHSPGIRRLRRMRKDLRAESLIILERI